MAAIEQAKRVHFDWGHFQRWTRIAPQRYFEVRFGQVDQPRQIRDALKAWSESDPTPNLILLGPVGSGKTFAAHGVLNHLLYVHPGRTAVSVSAAVMYESLRPDGGRRLADYIGPDYLLIDDLGVERGSEWVEERTFAILDGRWSTGRPTIITSNLAAPNLERIVGSRSWDRLRDGAVCLVLAGASRRGGTAVAS